MGNGVREIRRALRCGPSRRKCECLVVHTVAETLLSGNVQNGVPPPLGMAQGTPWRPDGRAPGAAGRHVSPCCKRSKTVYTRLHI